MATKTQLDLDAVLRVTGIQPQSDNPKSPVKVRMVHDGEPRRVNVGGNWTWQDSSTWVSASYFPSDAGFESINAMIDSGELAKGKFVTVTGNPDSEAYVAQDKSLRHSLIVRNPVLKTIDAVATSNDTVEEDVPAEATA